ncbi:MAG: hypothetical protein ACXWQ5_03285 [Ktedonobacterales bacterium]
MPESLPVMLPQERPAVKTAPEGAARRKVRLRGLRFGERGACWWPVTWPILPKMWPKMWLFVLPESLPFFAGIVAGDVVKVTRSALRLIFSRDPAVAIAVQMQARRRGVLPFLPLFRFLMV